MCSDKRGMRPLIWVIAIVSLRFTPLLTTHEPSSIHPACQSRQNCRRGAAQQRVSALPLLEDPEPQTLKHESQTSSALLHKGPNPAQKPPTLNPKP